MQSSHMNTQDNCIFSLVYNLREKIEDCLQPAISIVLTGQTENPLRKIQTKVCHCNHAPFVCLSAIAWLC